MGMYGMLVGILVAGSLSFVAEAIAQTQAPPPPRQRPPPPLGAEPPRGEEKIVEGQVKSIDPSGTAITLTDGTTLMAPPGAAIRAGILMEGTTVIAAYTEENGKKILTELVTREPSASPPTEPRTPGEPSTAPPSGSPKRR